MGGSPRDQALVTIDGYVLEGVLGRGGMGVVYRARQLSLGQPVAIKVLADGLHRQPCFVAQFECETRLQANLQHPHVMPVLDGGKADGVPYLVMRLIDGYSLRELIRAGGRAAVQVIDLLRGIASALDCGHASGILHLDVKPQNVLVEGERHAWLADFGLTRMLGQAAGLAPAGGLLGSLDYLAPEIARGEQPSPACDIYSLAVTTFQSLTGVLPFPVAQRDADVLAHASLARPRASVYGHGLPAALDAVLQRGLAIDPAARQPTAGALVDELRQAVDPRRRGVSPRRRDPRWKPGAAVASEAPSLLPTVLPEFRVEAAVA
jgi:serine/threonine kinase PknH